MRALCLTFAAGLVAVLVGCQAMQNVSQVGTQAAVGTGFISADQGKSIQNVTTAVGKSFEDITPQQEYYIGRSVGATILTSYTPYDNTAANEYLNLVGQTLARASDRPETYGGYHFLILNTSEINAFGAPGGLIFISRGMLRCCKTEDALAAVLAHEVSHIQFKHGLQSIRKERMRAAFTTLGAESAKNLGGQNLQALTSAFEGTVNDVTTTLVNGGYTRAFERQADANALRIMPRVGYDPHWMIVMLQQMKARTPPQGGGFAKTHPDPMDRIADVEKIIGSAAPAPTTPQRQARFDKALGNI